MKIITTLFLLLILTSCNGQKSDIKSTIYYVNSKAEFDKNLVDHFPKVVTTIPRTIENSKNTSKNDVGFILYEYSVDSRVKDSLFAFLEEKKYTKYNSRDNCLLIVNRFETLETYEMRLEVEIKDTSKINRRCYDKLLPIPNFIGYRNPDDSKDLKLDGDFDIFVIEAKSGNHFKKFDLLPNEQMPDNWKNGYSKGIAIGVNENTIIYWGIIW